MKLKIYRSCLGTNVDWYGSEHLMLDIVICRNTGWANFDFARKTLSKAPLLNVGLAQSKPKADLNRMLMAAVS